MFWCVDLSGGNGSSVFVVVVGKIVFRVNNVFMINLCIICDPKKYERISGKFVWERSV